MGNRDISMWDTSRVTNMYKMFYCQFYTGSRGHKFNQDISMWNTSRVTDMYKMFYNAKDFYQCLASWAAITPTSADVGSMFAKTKCPGSSTPAFVTWEWCQTSDQQCTKPSSNPSSNPSYSSIPSSTPSLNPSLSPSSFPSVEASNGPSSSPLTVIQNDQIVLAALELIIRIGDTKAIINKDNIQRFVDMLDPPHEGKTNKKAKGDRIHVRALRRNLKDENDGSNNNYDKIIRELQESNAKLQESNAKLQESNAKHEEAIESLRGMIESLVIGKDVAK